jgi:PAS domain S-box-containing protein
VSLPSPFRGVDEPVAGPPALTPQLHFRALVEAFAEGVYLVDTSGVCVYANPAVGEMLGHDVGALIGTDIHSVIHHSHADGSPFPRDVCPLFRGATLGIPCEVTDQVLWRADGTPLPVEYRTRPLEADGRLAGAVVTFHAFLRDVTERQVTARSLERSEELHRLLTEQSTDLISRHTRDGRFLYVSPASCDLLGHTPEELMGRLLQELVHPDDVGNLDGVSARVLDVQERAEVTLRLRHRDGHWVWVESVLSALGSEDGTSHVQAQTRDITDRHVREAQLEQASRLEGLGRLSAELAHEINTPIQFVSDNTRFLAEACQDLLRTVLVYRELLGTPEPLSILERRARARAAEERYEIDYLEAEIPSAVAQTLDGIDRVSTIVRAMRTFSHPGRVEQADADLNDALTAAVTVARHQVGSAADVRVDLARLPLVRCNVTDLNLAFLNLIVNAMDSIEEIGPPGTIRVATSVDGAHVTVSISDTGSGIPEDVLPKIFDPFFTTKAVGRGSGQGLALVRAIVQEGHGGTVVAASRPGSGSTFTIRLPISGVPQPH